MMEWINVKEKLPPEDVKVFVLWNDEVELAYINPDVHNWQEWPYGDFQCHEDMQSGFEVTHWMPVNCIFQLKNIFSAGFHAGNNMQYMYKEERRPYINEAWHKYKAYVEKEWEELTSAVKTLKKRNQ